MSKIALIYPGQGAQHAGMGKAFYDAEQSVRERFSECSELLSCDMAALCFSEDERLNETQYTQPAMVLMELALTEAVKKHLPEPAAFSAGLSLGEYAAIAETGAMTFSDAVKTVAERGRFMAEAVPSGEGAMAAVLGAETALIEEVIRPIDHVYIANYNCPGQIVITGLSDAVREACVALSAAGVRKTVPLQVSGPFHSPLLSGAGEKLGNVLSAVSFSEPSHPYLANVTAEPVMKASEIPALLTAQVSSPVHWQQSIERMLSEGADTFIEIGPGKTLAGFMRKILKEQMGKGADTSRVRTFSVETPEDLAALCAAL